MSVSAECHAYQRSPSLAQYMVELADSDPLTRDQEASLAGRIREGDESAIEELIRANLKFVVTVARQYQNKGLPLEDLIAEGNVGLIEAARRFDETKGFKFISYAVWWIRQAILSALATHSRIFSLPPYEVVKLRKVFGACRELAQDLGREPQASEIAEEVGLDYDSVYGLLSLSRRHFSLDRPLEDRNGQTLLDILEDPVQEPPDHHAIEESRRGAIRRMLSILTEREAEILTLYFGFDGEHALTLEQIAARFGLSRERIRQIRNEAIKKIRRRSRNQLFPAGGRRRGCSETSSTLHRSQMVRAAEVSKERV